MTSWDDDFNAFMGNDAGPSDSFIDRARAAPDDDDFNMGEDYGAPPPPGLAHVAVLGQDVAEETAFQQFIRHWMNERHAPDILPGQEMLLGRILDHVRKQVSCLVLFCVFCQGEGKGHSALLCLVSMVCGYESNCIYVRLDTRMVGMDDQRVVLWRQDGH